MWALLIFEPEWFISEHFGGGAVLKRIPTVLLIPLAVLTLQRWRPRAVYWPFLLFVLLHLLWLPFVPNRGLSMPSFKLLFHFFCLFTATACILRTPAQVVPLLKMLLLGFIWYGLQGITDGRVQWQTALGNEDGFGPFMSMGIGLGYCLARGSRAKTWRYLGYSTAVLSSIGVIASFARGAVLSAGVVGLAVWLRSPRKMATLFSGIFALIVVLVSAEVLYPDGALWDEMSTISEGTEGGTGQDRWVLWTLAFEVFLENPVLGVGLNNFGAAAVNLIAEDQDRARYRDPSTLYNRALHNGYVQVLVEEGLVGIFLFGFMIIDLLLRLRRLRRAGPAKRWRRGTGGVFDLRSITLGLEASLIAFCFNAIFYNQVYEHHFWTLLCLAFVLELQTNPSPRHTGQSVEQGRAKPDSASLPMRRSL